MSFDPEKFRLSWMTLITAVTSLASGVALLFYEALSGDYNPAAMAIAAALIAGSPAAVAFDRAGKR